MKGKQLAEKNYKEHVDGYNQMDMITGKGPSARHEIYYFTESNLAAVRIDDFKYRFIEQPGGWIGDKSIPDAPVLVNLRLDPFEDGMADGKWKFGSFPVLRLVPSRVLAIRVRPTGSGEADHDGHRVPAGAEGR